MGLEVVQERSRLSVPSSTLVEILNELKIISMLLADLGGNTDDLTDLRKDINLLSE